MPLKQASTSSTAVVRTYRAACDCYSPRRVIDWLVVGLPIEVYNIYVSEAYHRPT